MPGTFFGFNTALRGMQAAQRNIYTTAHNIANANTEGYTRQQVVLATTPPYPVPSMNRPGGTGWQIGTGVDSQETRRLRDEFLDIQIRRETGTLGMWQQIQDFLSQVEIVFNEPSDTGLSTLISQFWAAWQELSKNAESSPVRTTVVETASALAEAFNHSAQQLETIIGDIDQSIALKAMEINSLVRQIADLNLQIKNIVAVGDQPNDLMDQRDLLLDRLSKIIDYEIENNIENVNGVTVADGQIKIKVDGTYLLEINNGNNIIHEVTANGAESGKIYWKESGAEISLARGEIKGLQQVRQNVGFYLDRLDVLARGLAENINAIHSQGLELSGQPVGGTIYENFFVDVTSGSGNSITAKNIGVNPNIKNDVTKIAAADTNGGAGNGANALKIAQLQSTLFQEKDSDGDGNIDTLVTGASGVTLDDYYKNFTAKLGVDAHEASRMVANQKVLVDQLTNRKESISGVSLDEEMANMLQYQRAYEAAARMITTLDAMLDKIINGMGVTR